MADKNIGKITQVIGAVLDLKFSEGYCRRSTMRLRLRARMEENLW